MRIAHVVTYISPDGAFGGPVRVALGQARELAARGHEVTVFAAAPSGQETRTQRDGYELRTFPARRISKGLGFAGLYAYGLTSALKAAVGQIDVAHIHLARDLVTLPAARTFRRARVPYVVQTHGMVDRSSHPLAPFIDRWETKKALRRAAVAFVLTDQEEQDLADVAPGVVTSRITNGVSLGHVPTYEGRKPVVLFLARLHPRKRALAFIEMAEIVGKTMTDATFVLVGPDEGDGPAVKAAITRSWLGSRICWAGAMDPEDTGKMMAAASVYVLPSVGEVFPMSLLEAFTAGTPAVVTESLGMAAACHARGAAKVTDGTPEALARSVLEVLQDPVIAQGLIARAELYVREELSISRVANQLEQAYLLAPTGRIEAN